MKTIYTTKFSEPTRVTISDEILASIDEAGERVASIAAENPMWEPSIKIRVPNGSDQGNDEGFIVDVGWSEFGSDLDREDKMPSDVGENGGRVSVDLGYEGYESWETVIDDENLLELPDVHFAGIFVRSYACPRDWRPSYKGNWTNIVLPEHQRDLVPLIIEEARQGIDYRKLLDDKRSRMLLDDSIRVTGLCQDILEGKKNFSDLETLCNSFGEQEVRNEVADAVVHSKLEGNAHFGSPERQ